MADFEHGDYVWDRDGEVWLVTHGGGMAARATHTMKGIESAGIVWLENNRGPLRKVIDIDRLEVPADGVIVLVGRLPLGEDEISQLREVLDKNAGKVIVVDGTVCHTGVERLNPGGMPDDQQVVGIGELAMFLGGSHDSWTGDFLRLVAKSDYGHREQLRIAYPLHVHAWEVWVSRPLMSVAELMAACRS